MELYPVTSEPDVDLAFDGAMPSVDTVVNKSFV